MIQIANGLFFDVEKHHYYSLEHDRILSNTDFLGALGFSDYSNVPDEIRETALQIGTDVHAATALMDKGLDWRQYKYVQGYVRAWKRFKKEMKFKPIMIEEPLLDRHHMIATTPDRCGISKFADRTTVQIKTGHIEDWVALQTAFEERCILLKLYGAKALAMPSSKNRFAVELRVDGTYNARRFTDASDIQVYYGAHSYYLWQLNHGKKVR